MPETDSKKKDNLEPAVQAGTSKEKPSKPKPGGEKPSYKGDPGPQSGRSCQDIPFLILFVLVVIGMLVVDGLAYQQGNLARLKYGNDSEGNLCGTINSNGRDLRTKPYQYFFNPLEGVSTYRICVADCPKSFGNYTCKYDAPTPKSAVEFAQAFLANNCTLTYQTTPVLNRCFPNSDQMDSFFQVSNSTSGTLTISNFSDLRETSVQIVHEVYDAWKTIAICCGVSFFLSFVWIFLLQHFASYLIWSTLIAVNIMSSGFTAYIWYSWYYVKTNNRLFEKYTASIKTASYNEQTLLVIGGVSGFFAFICLLVSLVLRKRIKLAVTVVEEASRAIRSMRSIMLFPVFKYIGIIGLTSVSIYIWALLATSGTIVSQKVTTAISNQAASSTGVRLVFEPNSSYHFLMIFYAFGFFWIYNWILAINQATIAGAIASYYWTRDKKSIAGWPVFSSFWRAIRYHLGSLAFGSLILAVIQTIRAVLTYLQTQLRGAKENRVAKFLLMCLNCCCGCLEILIRFLNRNAYIEIAIYGYPFCKAAKTAFQLLIRNALRVAVVDKVADFLLFLGKIMITLATSFVGVVLLQMPEVVPGWDAPDVGRFWAVPLIMIALLSYIVASCFMTVYEMAIDTIFLSFCEDCERNDGVDKPYFMTENLKKFLDQSPKVSEKVGGGDKL